MHAESVPTKEKGGLQLVDIGARRDSAVFTGHWSWLYRSLL